MVLFERISRVLSRFKRNAEGGVAILFALSATALLVAGGVALDYQRLSQTQAALQDSLDAALLAAATSSDYSKQNLDAIIANYLLVNWTSKNPDVKLKYNYTVSNDGVLTGTARAYVKTTLMALVGHTRMTVDVTSQVVRGGNVIELALVLDTTGSMNSNNRMVALKKAATDLVKSLIKEGGEDVRIAVVPYADYVNVGTAYEGESWLNAPASKKSKSAWYGCVGSRDYPLDMSDSYGGVKIPAIRDITCTNEVVRLTSQQGPLASTIESMHPSGYTYIPAGLTWGWRVLSDELPFADGTPKGVKINNKPVAKVVVLMTDGENTRSPTYPKHDGWNTRLSDTLTQTLCTNMKDDGITIYTVAFEITGSTAKDVLESCASSPGKFFDAQSADQLASSFTSIGKALSQLRIAQ
jgi:Flp pilus assembly protein TadG